MKYAQEIRKGFVCHYLNTNLTLRDLAKVYNIGYRAAANFLQEMGVQVQNRNGNALTFQNAERLLNDYKQGFGLLALARKYKIGYPKVRQILKDNNVQIRNYYQAQECKIIDKYYVNQDFFDNPENWGEAQAWILGWLGADGNNFVSKSSICLKLQERDKYILETIRELLGYEGPLLRLTKRDKMKQDHCILQIRNDKLSETLEKLGIVNNKTLIYEFPTCLRKDLIRHYIRGYFEGDGYFGKTQGVPGSYQFNQIGTKNFLIEHNKLLHKLLGINFKSIKPKTKGNLNLITCDYVIARKEELYCLYKFLYQDAKYFLPRKKERFDDFVNYLLSRGEKYNYLNLHII